MILLFALLAGLEEQTILRTLDAHFTGDYLLYDSQSKRTAGSRGFDAGTAVAIGSLIKPFTTIAYGDGHQFQYPEFTCMGKDCWLPRGHGKVRITEAIGHSCNAYFLSMAARMNPADVADVLAKLGVARPKTDVPQQTLTGMGAAWKFLPQQVAAAYAELVLRASQPGMREAVAGMRVAAKAGTARPLGVFTLAKTGTAPCPRDAGDGFAMALFPADSPRYALLVRVHNSTGGRTATMLAPALHRIRNGK